MTARKKELETVVKFVQRRNRNVVIGRSPAGVRTRLRSYVLCAHVRGQLTSGVLVELNGEQGFADTASGHAPDGPQLGQTAGRGWALPWQLGSRKDQPESQASFENAKKFSSGLKLSGVRRRALHTRRGGGGGGEIWSRQKRSRGVRRAMS